jgi:DNA-binding IclR family transcriptional regulator
MAERGYVETIGENGGYQLSTRFFSLGMRLYTRFELRNRARAHLETLAGVTGETCQLHIPNTHGMLVADVAHPPADFFIQVIPGAYLNYHANAFGKAVLAFLPKNEVAARLSGRLARLTDRTLTSAAQLEKEFKEIRRTGLAHDREEYVCGVYCIGAPVFDATGGVVAGVGMTGLAARQNPRQVERWATAVLMCAEAISGDIGYTGEHFAIWRRGV